jgi:hypothetical protein
LRKAKSNIFARVERLAKLIQNLTIVFGVLAGLVAIFSARFDKRVDLVMTFNREYNDSIRKEYLGLISRWDKFAESAGYRRDLSLDDKKLMVLKFFKSTENVDSLRNISDFFYTLFVCVKGRACDRNTALDLFSNQAKTVFESFGFYILERRDLDKDETTGDGLEGIYRLNLEGYIFRYF